MKLFNTFLCFLLASSQVWSSNASDADVVQDEAVDGNLFQETYMETKPAFDQIDMMMRSCRMPDGQSGTCVANESCPIHSHSGSGYGGAYQVPCNYVDFSDGNLIHGVCCIKGASPAGGNGSVIPTVPIDPSTGLPFPGFPWWQYFPYYPSKPIATTTTTTPGTPMRPHLSCGPRGIPTVPVDPNTGLPSSDFEWWKCFSYKPLTVEPTIAVGMAAALACGSGPNRTRSFDEHRIVGGQEAAPNSWPFMVSLQYGGSHFCGGSLISSNYILTAAHCLVWMRPEYLQDFEVVLGLHTLSPMNAGAIRKKVQRYKVHEKYNAENMDNDVAVIRIEKVTFTKKISPVCLPSVGYDDPFSGDEAVVIGWGSTEPSKTSNKLRQVTVKVQSNHRCRATYSFSWISDHMLCAAYPCKDSCQGDSGGPLIVQLERGAPWVQVGIVSWGEGCAQQNYPGVYARVTSFTSWIAQNTKN